MPRFGHNDGKPDLRVKFDYSKNDKENSLGKETGDASFCHPVKHILAEDESESVSNQKREFIRYMNSKKKVLPPLELKDVSEVKHNKPWDYKPDIKCLLDPDPRDKDTWLEECALSAGSDGDHFHKVYNAKSPSAEKAAALLDELVELREELFDRIKDLTKFKKDVREVGKLIRGDPWEKVQKMNAQQSAGRADKVLDSVELTTNRIESFCGLLDQEPTLAHPL